MTIGNTPRECDTSDTAISRLLENDVRLLDASQTEDWAIDINDDGAMVGECPRCGCKEISAVTPEHLQCNGCGHRDGTQYRAVDFGPFEPNESVPVRQSIEEDGE